MVRILDLFRSGQFEDAVELLSALGTTLSKADIDHISGHFQTSLREAVANNDFQSIRQVRLRTERFSLFCESRFDPNALIPPVILPDNYDGKILLVSIGGGVIEPVVCLRSNDLHHRDILKNTEMEIMDLGLHRTRVRELGGAGVSCGADGTMCIRGGSDDFGPCDRQLAAGLIGKVHPGKSLIIEE